MLSVKQYKQLEDVINCWQELYDDNKNLSIYQSPNYVRTVCNHLWPYKLLYHVSVKFLVVYDDEKPIVIFPLYHKWFSEKHYLFGYKMGCGYLNVIYSDSISEMQMVQCIKLVSNMCKELCFNYVPEDSLLAKVLLQCDWGNIEAENYVCICINKNYEDFRSQLRRNIKNRMRVSYNRITKHTDSSKYALKIYDSKDISQKFIKQLQQIYFSRLKFRYRKGLKDLLFRKYVDVLNFVEREGDDTKFYVLYIDGDIAAYMSAGIRNRRMILYRISINQEYAWFSPGILLLNETIKYLCEQKIVDCLDLTHGDERYKLEMGGVVEHCVEGMCLSRCV